MTPVVTALRVLFPVLGLLNIVVGWPLARRRIPPNLWYGLRVRTTLRNPEAWYAGNAECGRGLVRLGVVLLALALALPLLPGLPGVGYALICGAIMVIGSSAAIIRGLGAARRARGGPGSGAPRVPAETA